MLLHMSQPKCIKEWFANDKLFKSELAKGRKWQLFVADRIRDLGYDAVVPDSVPYGGQAKAINFINEPDILVGDVVIEVKSRSYQFTCAADFPFDTIGVDTKKSFDGKTDKPLIYVCVCQNSGSMTALDVQKTRKHWVEKRRFDRVRNIPVVSLDCHKDYWEDLETVCRRILG